RRSTLDLSWESSDVYNSQFNTLEEKSKTNPKINKLYGSPHIYFWDHIGIAVENIKWYKF
ncbi:hypothetical protein JDS87_33380, partial [Bacillus cereus]|uniref:hypothetical protein n=1 Tax=Bacillus cereus TaxID=1396 RepID=UPI0018F38397